MILVKVLESFMTFSTHLSIQPKVCGFYWLFGLYQLFPTIEDMKKIIMIKKIRIKRKENNKLPGK